MASVLGCRDLHDMQSYEGEGGSSPEQGSPEAGPLEPGEYVLKQNTGADGASLSRSQTFRLSSVPVAPSESQVGPGLANGLHVLHAPHRHGCDACKCASWPLEETGVLWRLPCWGEFCFRIEQSGAA